ncbi:hypothetical protein [Altererythrobacter ishigakiensis]|uniref:Uncharacterized protein n=1 Tax=Altererythrobacter ishigakiensis TaxID=476157 RepID=A0A562UVW2_9SPHN|nr:hypothetical protein [Altererythrobacter ishigakiensis]TWJ09761.1 hypothetical protein JN10_1406 [Altererythrobacter ishigakiensis]
MTLDELKEALRAILAIEEQGEIDWCSVEAMCHHVIEELAPKSEPEYPHDMVYRFLDDPDVRQKDTRYADRQRKRLRAWLS